MVKALRRKSKKRCMSASVERLKVEAVGRRSRVASRPSQLVCRKRASAARRFQKRKVRLPSPRGIRSQVGFAETRKFETGYEPPFHFVCEVNRTFAADDVWLCISSLGAVGDV